MFIEHNNIIITMSLIIVKALKTQEVRFYFSDLSYSCQDTDWFSVFRGRQLCFAYKFVLQLY